jgi:cell division protein FtsL
MEAARQIIPEFQELVLDFPARHPATRQVVRPRFAFNQLFIVLALFVLAGMAVVSQRILIAQNGIDIARLKSEIKKEQRLEQVLSAQATLLKSPARIEKLADKRLGMVKPERVTYIEVSAEAPALETGRTELAREISSLSQPAVMGRVVSRLSLLVN